MKSSSWCRGMGLLALVACTLLLFTVTIPSTTVNAATENAVEWNDHITYVDSLENELNQPTSLIEGGSELDIDTESDADSEVELDDSTETELDSDQELDSDVDQDADGDVEDDASDASMTSHGFMELSQAQPKPSKFAAAVSKVKNVLKALNPFATKVPPQSPAVALSAQEHQAKWAAFKAANPKKKYKSSAEEQAAFNTFQANRAKILEQNNAVATKLNPKPFSSKGPFADLPKEKFHSTHLKLRAPKRNNPSAPTKAAPHAAKPSSATKAHRFVGLDMEVDSEKPGAGGKVGSAGTSAGSAGTSAGSAGTSAGSAGTSAGKSGHGVGSAGTSAGSAGTSAGSAGTSAGSAGTSAGSAGTSAGSAGTSAGSAGTSAGSAGTSAGDSGRPVVAPTKAELAAADLFKPYSGSAFNNPDDDTAEKRVCRVVSHVWFARYASTSWDKFLQFGSSFFKGGGFDRFNKDPMLLCSASGWFGFWDKMHPKQELIREIFKELMSRPSGTSFMNPVVATSDQALDQEQCGSCYAQAAVGSLEAALKKAGRYTGPLSIQQAIDCVKTKDSGGCAGGTPMDVIDYFKTAAPSLAVDYPYTGVQGRCNVKRENQYQRSSGWTFASPPPQGVNFNEYKACLSGDCKDQIKYETDLFFGVKSAGPYIAYVDASNWQHYGGGIYPPDKCSSTNEAGNHVVQLLGYGQENGIPYWIIKNSWGPEWGEKGYIRLPMGVNACGVANYVLQATV